MKLFLLVIIVLAIALFAIFLYTWYRMYQSLHFHVPADQKNIQKYKTLPRESHTFTTTDGVKIASWYVKTKNPKAFLILVHGYETQTGGKTDMLGYAKFLSDAGYSSLLIDLRSFGESQGNQIYLGVREWRDVETAYDYLSKQPEAKGKKIGLLGVSMGAATSIITAGETGKVDFIIASVPYASYADLLYFRTKKEGLSPHIFTPPLKLAASFVLDTNYSHYDPLKEIKKIHVPITIFQALKDKSVPPFAAQQLYDTANEPKSLWTVNGGHDIFAEKPEEFKKHVLDFLQKYIGK